MSELAERRAEDKQRRRDQILDAAVAVASETGLQNFSMDQVARKARLSRALIYVYFHDRLDILFALAERAHHMLHGRFQVITARKQNSLKKLQALGRDYVQFAHDSPVYFDALCAFASYETSNEEQRAYATRCLECGAQLTLLIEELLKSGIADGSLRKNIGPPRLVALTLWSFFQGVVQVVTTKKAVLEFEGAKTTQLVDQAIAMCTRALEKE